MVSVKSDNIVKFIKSGATLRMFGELIAEKFCEKFT